MVQSHILDHGNLQYDNFMVSFLKLIVSKLINEFESPHFVFHLITFQMHVQFVE